MARSLVATEIGVKRAKEALIDLGITQTVLAEKRLKYSRSTVSNFFNRKPIAHENFTEICKILKLEWRDIAEIAEEEAIPDDVLESSAIVASSKSAKEEFQKIDDKVKQVEKQIRLAFAIAGTVNQVDEAKLNAIVKLLRQITGDASIEIVDIQEGSIKLILTGTPEALEMIQALYRSGELTEIEGIPIEYVDFDNISSQYQQDQRGLWIPNSRCRKIWGRDTFSKKVLSRLTDFQEPSILAICGGAGYGKTEVAVKVARAAITQHLFTDVLWVKARDTEFLDGSISQPEREEAVSWQQVSQELAHQLNGCSTERLHQFMKEEKRLIVLDNAETAQLEEILPKLNAMLNPSRLLLISRYQISAPYVELINIPPLEEHFSYHLLQYEAEWKKIPALLEASLKQRHQIYELSCGAPLALHFIVGRILDDGALEPVLLALERASGDVEKIYEFSLKTAWQRIGKVTKKILGYMGDADAGVTWEELSGAGRVQKADWKMAQRELKRWYLIEETTDSKGKQRYNVHPWVRRSLRGGLVDRWERSLQEWEEMAVSKYNIGGNLDDFTEQLFTPKDEVELLKDGEDK